MNKVSSLIATVLIMCSVTWAQQTKFTVSGNITDTKNGEELIGASVYIEELKIGAATNTYGFYSLRVSPGKYNLVVSYIGYETQKIALDVTTADKKLNVQLKEEKQQLDEIVISADKPNASNVQETKMSVVKVDIKEVRKIPLLLGEVDIIKAVQLLPGIQAAGDGNTLFTVRGGNTDHNLIYLDEAVVYNPSHVVGFFSVFNGDAIKDFEIYKGGIPAQYGGRLASVLDVRMKDGNNKNYGVSGGIGILSSRLTIEGPIQKDKSSFMISGRRSYFDLFFPLSSQTRDVTTYFGDLNVKLNYKISDKDRIYVSGYIGQDVLATGSLFGLGWGNQTATLRWNHLFNSRLFSNTSFIISRYNYKFDLNLSPTLNLSRTNFIQDYTLKQDFNYFANPKNTIKFGFVATHHTFSPGEIKPITKESIIRADKLPEKRALDNAIYVSHNIKINQRLSAEYGLRYNMFQNIGGTVLTYANDKPNFFDNGFLLASDPSGRTDYSSNEIHNTLGGLEPRANITYLLNSSSSIKGSYNRMYQYMHLIQPTNATTGQEFWVPSDRYIKPQIADQVGLGYFKNIMENVVELSAEVYYKNMQNTVELIDNADVQFIEGIETQVVSGQGRAYGLELFARKKTGATTGWVSYALGKSERRADGINNNEWYRFRFDRRNYVTVVVTHELSKRISLSGNFIYATGDTYTPAVGFITFEGNREVIYGERNGARLPNYHRMDMSVIIGRKVVPGKVYKNESNWVISVYNVYGRKNAYSIDFRQNEETGQNEAIKTYLFTFVPSITYNFKF
jgi:hypothetical protein